MQFLSPLHAVHWQKPAKSATALTERGVVHGFNGVGDTPPVTHSVKQVHGTAVVEAQSGSTGNGAVERVAADGVYTMRRGETVAVKTADCLPVLMVAPGKFAAAVHAGWRGLTAGILSEAVRAATRHGVAASELLVAIGPAIGREQFEVGPEVIEAFHAASLGLDTAEANLCIAKGAGDRWHADLTLAAVLTLLKQGVAPAHMTAVQACTRTLPAWYSYRREGKGVPSNWSWVTL